MAHFLVFYQKDRLDSFLGVHAINQMLAKQAKDQALIAVTSGSKLPDVKDKHLFFFDVDLDCFDGLFDISQAKDVIMVLRDPGLNGLKEIKLPSTVRLAINATGSMGRRTWEYFLPNPVDLTNNMPEAVRYIASVLEKPEDQRTDDDKFFLIGVEQDISVKSVSTAYFQTRIVEPFKANAEETKRRLTDDGRRYVDNHQQFVRRMVERSAITAQFLGANVRIAHVPEEFAQAAGELMAENYPFSVTYEDIPAQSMRLYRLYSTEEGYDVKQLTKAYNPTGTEHQVSFTVKLNFNNHKWI